MSKAERTDSRPLGIRKTSVVMRKIELQAELRAVESAEAEIDRLIEADERARERAIPEWARGACLMCMTYTHHDNGLCDNPDCFTLAARRGGL